MADEFLKTFFGKAHGPMMMEVVAENPDGTVELVPVSVPEAPVLSLEECAKEMGLPETWIPFLKPGAGLPVTMPVYHKNNKDDWGSPQWLVDMLAKEFGPFDLDPAADEGNAKAPIWFNENGLAINWFGTVWLNPPYSQVGKWVDCACEQVEEGHCERIVMLVAARPDTQWWWQAMQYACEIRFLKGRLKFEVDGVETKNAAPFPSAILIFDKLRHKQRFRYWDPKKGVETEYAYYQVPVPAPVPSTAEKIEVLAELVSMKNKLEEKFKSMEFMAQQKEQAAKQAKDVYNYLTKAGADIPMAMKWFEEHPEATILELMAKFGEKEKAKLAMEEQKKKGWVTKISW